MTSTRPQPIERDGKQVMPRGQYSVDPIFRDQDINGQTISTLDVSIHGEYYDYDQMQRWLSDQFEGRLRLNLRLPIYLAFDLRKLPVGEESGTGIEPHFSGFVQFGLEPDVRWRATIKHRLCIDPKEMGGRVYGGVATYLIEEVG